MADEKVSGDQMWADLAGRAFIEAEMGNVAEALEYYRRADQLTRSHSLPVRLNPELSMLRHMKGEAEGGVISMPPNEDWIVSVQLGFPGDIEADCATGMEKPDLDRDRMIDAIRRIIGGLNAGYHAENIKAELPHIQVLSTGRAGTVSLFHLFEQSQYIPYHTYPFTMPHMMRNEMAYRIMDGDTMIGVPATWWVKTRAAEWIGCVNQGRPMADVNHLDVVFAPVFAAIHPRSRFIHLVRDPVKTFESFYSKDQWSDKQIIPLYHRYGDDGEFLWRHMRYPDPQAIAWFIRWTEVFCEALEWVLGDRFTRLYADKLFAGDREEAEFLVQWCELPFSANQVVEHYKIPYNSKLHKICRTQEQVDAGREQFISAYKEFGGEL